MKRKIESVIPFVKDCSKKGPFLTRIPIEKEYQDDLGREMLMWVRSDDVFSLEDFPISKCMSPTQFYRIAETNDYFEECLDIALMTIGSRLQRAWRERMLEKQYVLSILPLYNSLYRRLVLEKHKITEETRTSGNTFQITIPPIPEKK